jgi:predicted MarR family transcription regulator
MAPKGAAQRRNALSELGHLSVTPAAARVTALEFTLEYLVQAYYRWKSLCYRAGGDHALSGEDVALLNTIRMGEEPKRLSEIGSLLNRTDTANLQYAVRKLIRAGLIANSGSASRRETRYQVTAAGRASTNSYAAIRAGILLPLMADDPQIDTVDLERCLAVLARHYQDAGHRAIVGRHRLAGAPAKSPSARNASKRAREAAGRNALKAIAQQDR